MAAKLSWTVSHRKQDRQELLLHKMQVSAILADYAHRMG